MKTLRKVLVVTLSAGIGCGQEPENLTISRGDAAELSVLAAHGLHPMAPAEVSKLGTVSPTLSGCTWLGPFGLKYAVSSAFVSAEIGWAEGDYGMLRARSAPIGLWERFSLCLDGSGVFIYSHANGQWVSAELGAPGAVYGYMRARASERGLWERFQLVLTGGIYALKSTENGLYVSTELGYPGHQAGMLRARAGGIGDWEKFFLIGTP